MKKEGFFKLLFWILTVGLFGSLTVMLTLVSGPFVTEEGVPIFIILLWWAMLIIAIAVVSGISVFVYRDAGSRGLNKWMWMTIAIYVPNLIGLILYFVFRNNDEVKCFNCGKAVKKDFEVCPYCKTNLKAQCHNCSKTVDSKWSICPYCGTELK